MERQAVSLAHDQATSKNANHAILHSLSEFRVGVRRVERLLSLVAHRLQHAANADTSTSLPAGFHTPETLATDLGVSLSTINS